MRKSPYGLLNEIGVQVRHLYDTRDDTATESKGHDADADMLLINMH